MTKKKSLYEEAIADAKALKNTAIANAKAALEETFTPKIMSMLSNKLNEEEDKLDENEELEEAEELEETEEVTEAEELEEADLDSLIAELESEELSEEEQAEAKKDDKKDDSKKDEPKKDDKKGEKKDDKPKDDKPKAKSDAKPAAGAGADAAPKDPEEEKLTSITVGELTSLITSAIAAAMGGDQTGAGIGADDAGADVTADIDGNGSPDAALGADLGGEDEDAPLDLESTFAEVESEIQEAKKKKEDKKKDDVKESIEIQKYKKALKEALKTIAILKENFNDINLLNAKLEHVTKLFKAKTLSESEKRNVINAFDKAESVKEVKGIYEALSSIGTKTNISKFKKPIKESMGFASKSIGNMKKKDEVVEVDATVARMQKLAGIIKVQQ